MSHSDDTWTDGSATWAPAGAAGTGAPSKVDEPRYEPGEEIGSGGIGTVARRPDRVLGRDVAYKRLRGRAGKTIAPATVARFVREAQITAQLEHPNIVPVYDAGEDDEGRAFYTMRLVRGRSLQQALSDCASLEDRLLLLPHFVDVCQGMAYAHSRGVVHRDLKPANVMVGGFGETQIVDWGLAKFEQQDDEVGGEAVGPTDAGQATAEGGEPVGSFEVQAPGSLAWTPDSTALFGSFRNDGVRSWHEGEWSEVEELASGVRPYELALSADGSVLAVLDVEATVRLYDAHTFAKRGEHEGDRLRSIALSADGTRLALGGSDLIVLDWAKDEVLWSSDAHEGSIDKIEWSPDSQRLATASWDQTARIWSAEDGTALAVLRGHEHRVVDVSFSADGETLHTASWDRTARRWDLRPLDQSGDMLIAEVLAEHGLRVSGARVHFEP